MIFFGANPATDDDDDDNTTNDQEAAADAADGSADTTESGDQDSAEATDAGAAAPVSAPEVKQQQPSDSTSLVKDYLAKKYGLGGSAATYQQTADDAEAKVQAARDQAKSDRGTIGLFQGLSTMFGRPNEALFNAQRADVNQNLGAALQDRQQKLQDMLNSNNLGRQDVADALKAKQAKFQEGQNQRLQMQQAAMDAPDSAESEFARNMAKRFDKKGAAAGLYDTTTDEDGKVTGLSATQIQQKQPWLKDLFDQTMKQEDMQLRWAMLNNDKQWQRNYKQQQLLRPVVSQFNKDENAYQTATGKIDETLNMVDQATKGGVASQLVPLEVARGIAGRLNPQEIQAAGGDPSTVGKIQRYFEKAANGTMTVQDAQEYRTLLQSQKDTLSGVREKNRTQNIGAWANELGMKPSELHLLLMNNGEATPAAPAAGGKGSAATAPAAPAAAAPKRAVSQQDLSDYATKHKMTTDDAKKWLISQGYSVQD